MITQKGRILVVDDESDILDSIEEALGDYNVTKASSFETARELLETEQFELTILDIMGVRGYDLLKIAVKKEVPAIMLTAHALTAEDMLASLRNGAYAYVPKDAIRYIGTFAAEAIEAGKGQPGSETQRPNARWFDRLKPFFLRRFGPEALKQIGFHI